MTNREKQLADMLMLLRLAGKDVDVELPATEKHNACLAIPVTLSEGRWKCDVWYAGDEDEPYDEDFDLNSEEGKIIADEVTETFVSHFGGELKYITLPVAPGLYDILGDKLEIAHLVRLLHRSVARILTKRVDPAEELCRERFGGVGA